MNRMARSVMGIMYVLTLLTLTQRANAQVPVALAPSLHPQLLDSTGKVLAGGFLYSYAAGTTTLQATYADSLGTIQNANPIPLDATGAPSNGSAQVEVWLNNQSFKFCAYNSALVQQWCWDNVSSYQILSSLPNVTFVGVTVDPTGAAGELGYRSDIPCFRGYTAFWDCFVSLTGIQTLTNKTIATPIITGTITGAPTFFPNPVFQTTLVPNLNTASQSISVANAGLTGTALFGLAKLTGAPSTAVVPAITDVGGVIGVVNAGAGTTGSATVQTNGGANCAFDGATVAGDYVQISATIAGDCHDVGGGSYPSSGQIVGRVLSSNVGAGTYAMEIFPPDIRAPNVSPTFPNVVYNTSSVSTNANILAVTMVTPSVTATYRINWYAQLTVLGSGCTNVTLASITFKTIWQDPLAAAPGSQDFNTVVANSATPNGVLGAIPLWQADPSVGYTIQSQTIRAKATIPIQYSVTYNNGTGCATQPSYQLFPILEQLTAN